MQSLYSGLAGYWNLQDQSGSRLDLTGNASTLTNTNTVTSGDGIISKASVFVTASSQRLNAASSALLQGGPKDYTLACWVNLTAITLANQGIISKSSATAGQKEFLLEFLGSFTNKFQFTVYRATDSAQTLVDSTFGTLTAPAWYFVVAWNDHANLQIGLEVNASSPSTLSLGGATQAASAAAFVIGASNNAGLDSAGASICEVSKWNRILTKQERVWLFNQGRGRTFPFAGRFVPGRHGRSRRLAGMAA